MKKKFDINKLKSKLNTAALKDKLKKIKAQYDRDAVLYTILLLGILVYGLPKFVFANLAEIPGNVSELNRQKKEAIQIEKKIKYLNKPQKEEKIAELPILIYESKYKDVDLENAATSIINRIISIIKNNGINKVELFEFEKKDMLDFSGLKSKNHEVLSLKVQMESTYENLQNIINEIYLMEYLIRIQSVSLNVNPNAEDKNVTAYVIFDIFVKTS